MATHEPVVLDGCAPTPLASYLKALGVLRLLSSSTNNFSGQAVDPRARGWWVVSSGITSSIHRRPARAGLVGCRPRPDR